MEKEFLVKIQEAEDKANDNENKYKIARVINLVSLLKDSLMKYHINNLLLKDLKISIFQYRR